MCFGPFTRLLHWGPLSVLAIIKCITGMTLYCVSMLWPPTSRLAIANTVFHLSLSGLTLYNFLCSVYHGPGYVELGWRPAKEEDISKLQFCEICNGYKAPRAHHCRKCGRCVLKMDHHCPWINNCVGWGNHCHFIAFLMFAVVGCFQASLILSTAFYKHLFVTWYIERGLRVTYFSVYGFIMCVFTFGMAFGVVIAVGMLLVCQVKAVIKNRTSIEDWIVEKAKFRRRKHDTPFIFPYDIGYFGNVRQVVTYNCEPWGDGIHYPVRRGCDQYTLTLEQIAQKLEKRERTKIYSITRNYSGSWIPITQGLKVCCSPPCTDEPRIKLQEGDTVVVTRWRKHWLYGVKMEDGLSAEYRVKGWFPRRCAVEINDELSDFDNGNGNDNRPRKKKLKKV